MEKITENVIKYTDSVELYAGYLTPLVAWWTLYFINTDKRNGRKLQRTYKMITIAT